MSYILEALKKAELQRDIGQVPGIGSEHEKPARTAVGSWIWIVAAVLVLNLVLLVYLLWPVSEPETADRYDPGLSQREPVIREPEQVSRLAAPEPVLPAATVIAKPAQPAPVVEPFVPAEPEPEPEQKADIQPVEEPAAEISSLPVWPQIPGHLFQQLTGGIHLDVHVYSDLPQDRFVLVNLRKYRVGEQLQEGPLVDEITPEGVILSFQGQQFLVRAQ